MISAVVAFRPVGDPPGRGTVRGQPLRQLPVQGTPDRHRPVLVQRIMDQLVPEGQPVPAGLDDPGPARPSQGLGQGEGVLAGQHRQLGDIDRAAADGSGPEQLDRVGRKQAEPVQDTDGQARLRSHALHLGLTGGGDGDLALLEQRGEQLDDEQRVARRLRHPIRQAWTRRAASDLPGEPEHRLGVERTQLKQGARITADGVGQRPDRLLVRRPRGDQDQSRVLPAQPGEPPQQGQARAVRPVEIVDDQQQRGRAAQRLEHPGQRLDQVMDLHRDVLEVTGPASVSLDPLRQFGQGRVGGPRRDPQCVRNRTERPGLIELACFRRSHDHAPSPGRAGDLIYQAGLADARISPQQHQSATVSFRRRQPFKGPGELGASSHQARSRQAQPGLSRPF